MRRYGKSRRRRRKGGVTGVGGAMGGRGVTRRRRAGVGVGHGGGLGVGDSQLFELLSLFFFWAFRGHRYLHMC